MKLDLRFFKMLYWGLEYCQETEKDLHLGSVIRAMGDELRKTAQRFTESFECSVRGGKITSWWWRPIYQLVDEVGTIKPYARKSCVAFLGGRFRCRWSSKSYGDVWRSVYAIETDCFIGFVLDNLQLLSLKLDGIAPLKQQIGFIQGKLKLFQSFVQLVSEWMAEDERLDKILLHTQAWAIHISCLACLYWVDGMDESQACTKAAMLSDLMQETMPYTAEVIILYFGVLTTTSPGGEMTEYESTSKIIVADFLRRIDKLKAENIMKLQSDHEEIKDFWSRIINVVYNADYVIKLSSTRNECVWYCIICLSTIIDDIKHIKIEVKEIQDHHMYKSNKLRDEMEYNDAQLPKATTSKVDGAFVGFEEDARSIIDQLIGGRKNLTIISISGMPGQGKTTLAQRIYSDPSIQSHFYKILWCYVSKQCKIRELLVEILRGVNKEDVEKNPKKLETQDVAERLRKSLKGKRCLIVMDDIWDVAIWRQVEGSFPNDSNGSRILFTSRNHNLASEAKQNSISHPLRLFSNDESWELMKERLFFGSMEAPEFLEIGKKIANCCKGLPLAVVLMAAILGRTEKKLALWNQVAENLKSHLAGEGCTHIIELSYKYLPDHLKPCFLYFGAFPRGKSIRARKLMLLWIAEGFVNENEMQCSDDMAKHYLDNLVSQSLVVVTERSSIGGIKACNVHDLLYDLCLEKAKEENFLNLTDETTFVDQWYFGSHKYNLHRLCIDESDSFTKPRPICTREELPSSPVHSILWSYKYSWREESTFSKFPASFLENFKVLTMLDLENAHLPWRVIPDIIMSIVHLKYLSI